LLLRSAIQINTEIGNNAGAAGAHLSLGTVLEKTNSTDAAIESFEKAFSMYQTLGDQAAACGAQANIAQCLIGRAEYPQAQQRLLEALKIAEGPPQSSGLLYVIYQGLGRIKGHQALIKEEPGYYALAMPHAADDYKRVTLLQVMAAAYIGDSQYEKALSVAQEGLEISRKKGFSERAADCLHQSAAALLHLDRLPEALQAADAAIAVAKKMKYQSFLPGVMVVRSRILTRLDQDRQAALTSARQTLALAQKMGKPMETVQAWEELAEAYRALNEADNAMDALRNSQRLSDSIFNKTNIREMAVQEKEYEFDKERAVRSQEKKQMEDWTAAELQQQRAQRNMWIIGLLGLLGIGLLSFFLWRNRQRNLVQLREAETRQRIARDLHDEVGSTLSSISILSETAGTNIEKGLEKARLDGIGQQAREALDSMSDIVWAINPDNDSMERVIARMAAFSASLFENAGMELQFDSEKGLESLRLPMERRRDFYLFFKEAVTNAARHSRAKTVSVYLKKEEGNLVLKVRDDGRGFDLDRIGQKKSLGGNGLRNLKSRAAAFGAEMQIESALHCETSVLLKIPLK